MQKWGVGLNGYHRTCSLWLDEGPWWSFWLQDAACWVCDHIPKWKVPFVSLFKVKDGGNTYTVAERYGDTWHDLFHVFVCGPVVQWAFGKVTKRYGLPVEWELGKVLFYKDDPERWDDQEREGDAMRLSERLAYEADMEEQEG